MKFWRFEKVILPVIFLLASVFLVLASNKNNFRHALVTSSQSQQNFLESYFRNKSDYDESFSKFENVEKKPVLAAITSHHFLAKDLIANTFAGIDPAKINRVIIVGPDHFHQLTGSKYFALTADTNWQTPFGDMKSDSESISHLSRENEISIDMNAFRIEHSIYILVPFAKKFFPEAKLIPIILRQKNDLEYYYILGKEVSSLVNSKEAILVISSDFSHNVSREQASINDIRSISLLRGMKVGSLNLVENDCRQCVAFLFGYLEDNNPSFEFVANKNSFDISGENPNSVTSYIAAYFIRKSH